MSATPIPAIAQAHPRVTEAAHRGDSKAFLTLITPSRMGVYRTALRITGNLADAEDVGQQTLLKAYSGIRKFSGATSGDGSSFAAWVSRIAANEAIDTIRRRHKGRLISFDDPAPGGEETDLVKRLKTSADDPEQRYARLELRRILASEIEQLNSSLRSVCLLRDVLQLSTHETAELLRISSAAVRIRLFRARLKLREWLRETLSWPSVRAKKPPHLTAACALPSFACGD